MEVTDLMIGDWVKSPKCCSKVSGLNTKPQEVSVDGVWFNDWMIQPIPLTSEILEKNGWDIEDTSYANYKLPDEFSSLEFYFHESRLRKWWEGVDEWDNHNKVRDITFQCHCTSIHELQHTLRLCGLNELANEFKLL